MRPRRLLSTLTATAIAGAVLHTRVEHSPDPSTPQPRPSEDSADAGFPYTGRVFMGVDGNGDVELLARSAATGDALLSAARGGGPSGPAWSLGGALEFPPALGPVTAGGEIAAFAVAGGALWFAPYRGTFRGPETARRHRPAGRAGGGDRSGERAGPGLRPGRLGDRLQVSERRRDLAGDPTVFAFAGLNGRRLLGVAFPGAREEPEVVKINFTLGR
jgi:hypothetical protein